jgi:hypothetical protein
MNSADSYQGPVARFCYSGHEVLAWQTVTIYKQVKILGILTHYSCPQLATEYVAVADPAGTVSNLPETYSLRFTSLQNYHQNETYGRRP